MTIKGKIRKALETNSLYDLLANEAHLIEQDDLTRLAMDLALVLSNTEDYFINNTQVIRELEYDDFFNEEE